MCDQTLWQPVDRHHRQSSAEVGRTVTPLTYVYQTTEGEIGSSRGSKMRRARRFFLRQCTSRQPTGAWGSWPGAVRRDIGGEGALPSQSPDQCQRRGSGPSGGGGDPARRHLDLRQSGCSRNSRFRGFEAPKSNQQPTNRPRGSPKVQVRAPWEREVAAVL